MVRTLSGGELDVGDVRRMSDDVAWAIILVKRCTSSHGKNADT
jgi:hypothetical protein